MLLRYSLLYTKKPRIYTGNMAKETYFERKLNPRAIPQG